MLKLRAQMMMLPVNRVPGWSFPSLLRSRATGPSKVLQATRAFDLLLGAGRLPKRRPLSVHDRIPLRDPVNDKPDCETRNLVLVYAAGSEESAGTVAAHSRA